MYWECNWCTGWRGSIGTVIGVQGVEDVLGV